MFINNSATTGGALYLSGRGQRSFVTDAQFVNNKADIDGGAVVANRVGRANDKAWFDNCTFEGNAAVESGGALVVSTGFVILNDSVFIDNEAGDFKIQGVPLDFTCWLKGRLSPAYANTKRPRRTTSALRFENQSLWEPWDEDRFVALWFSTQTIRHAFAFRQGIVVSRLITSIPVV